MEDGNVMMNKKCVREDEGSDEAENDQYEGFWWRCWPR